MRPSLQPESQAVETKTVIVGWIDVVLTHPHSELLDQLRYPDQLPLVENNKMNSRLCQWWIRVATGDCVRISVGSLDTITVLLQLPL